VGVTVHTSKVAVGVTVHTSKVAVGGDSSVATHRAHTQRSGAHVLSMDRGFCRRGHRRHTPSPWTWYGHRPSEEGRRLKFRDCLSRCILLRRIPRRASGGKSTKMQRSDCGRRSPIAAWQASRLRYDCDCFKYKTLIYIKFTVAT
jgi:hypothetical protein